MLIEGLIRIAGCAEREGVTLYVEPLPSNETDAVNTVEQAIAVIEAVRSPAVRLILDVKSMCAEGKPLAQIIGRRTP